MSPWKKPTSSSSSSSSQSVQSSASSPAIPTSSKIREEYAAKEREKAKRDLEKFREKASDKKRKEAVEQAKRESINRYYLHKHEERVRDKIQSKHRDPSVQAVRDEINQHARQVVARPVQPPSHGATVLPRLPEDKRMSFRTKTKK